MSWVFIGKMEMHGVSNLTLKMGEVVMGRGSQLLTTARVSTKLNLWIVGIGLSAKGARGVLRSHSDRDLSFVFLNFDLGGRASHSAQG